MKKKASAIWNGTGKEGKGTLSTQSGVLTNSQYSFKTRFEDGIGTNPEELIAAAHAGCFSMKLSFNISGEGLTPESIETTAHVNLNPDKGEIDTIHLEVTVKAPGLTQEKFDALVEDAKTNCPVSKVLNAEISIESQLLQ